MKLKFLVSFFTLYLACFLLSCESTKDNDEAKSKKENSLLDLFYGMEYDSLKNTYVDSILDVIPGLNHYEFDKVWFQNDEEYPISFNSQIGIYIDTIIPEKIWKNLEPIINKGLAEHISYDFNLDSLFNNEIYSLSSNPIQFARKWEDLMEKFSETCKPTLDKALYHKITPLRVCGVVHKIAESDEWATYIVEFSFDYHSGCGCPSYADYYTFRKIDGHLITKDEIIEKQNKSKLGESLATKFSIEATNRRRMQVDLPENVLFDEMTGAAYLKDGLLIYFHPYVVGFGAEGQYNLIINNIDLK